MAIIIACPHCQTKIQVLPEYSGKQVACPKCKGAFVVPQLATATPVVTASIAPEPPPVGNFPKAPVPSGSASNAPFSFLNEPSIQELQKKAKSFMDTLPAAVGSLFGSQSTKKNVQPEITTAQIGEKLKGLPPAKKALLGCGGVFAMFILCCILCSGLLTIGKPKGNVQTASEQTQESTEPTKENEEKLVMSGKLCHAEGKLKSYEEVPPPIKEALAKGRKIWCLINFNATSNVAKEGHMIYAIYNGDTLETIVEKGTYGYSPETVYHQWSLWYPDKSYEHLSQYSNSSSTRIVIKWTGQKDGDGIRLVQQEWITKTDKTYGRKPNIEGKVEIVMSYRTTTNATTQGWSANFEEYRDDTYTIDDEDRASDLSKIHFTFSPDGKTATKHSEKKNNFSGPVFQPH